MNRRVLIVFAGVLLAGCADRIWTDAATPNGVSLHWYTRETTIDAANLRANDHCAALGARAVLMSEFQDQDVTRAQYACRRG